MLLDDEEVAGGRLRQAIRARTRPDEGRTVRALLADGAFSGDARKRVDRTARRLVRAIRRRRTRVGGVESFLHEYGLTSREGVALMCLAEALLRVPDADTADRLIREKIGGAAWERHLGHSESLLVNASTWGLMLTGGVVRLGRSGGDLFGLVGRMVARSGEPVIREAVRAAMRVIGRQFVMGRTIEEALERAADDPDATHSFDMLGEAAMTAADAGRYHERYRAAVRAVGRAARGADELRGPSISVKLSALHPRFELAQAHRAVPEVADRLAALAALAKGEGIQLTVDAEEAARLEPTLDVFERTLARPELAGWDGLGLAVQAYQKRAPAVIDWIADRARRGRRRIPVRLVKGAYWDTEIKYAQEAGLSGYPVYTRKAATDLSYVACARRMMAAGDGLYPQFASHNAHTVAAVIEIAREAGRRRRGGFELQRLHGMGEALYGYLAERPASAPEGGHPVRVYAPVGSHEDLLPYLVRRLLENGANTSFVNRIADEDAPLAALVADPAERIEARIAAREPLAHPRIPLPRDLFAPERPNSAGVDLDDPRTVVSLGREVAAAAAEAHHAAPLIGSRETGGKRPRRAPDPADTRRAAGLVAEARVRDVDAALASVAAGTESWGRTPAETRAAVLEDAAGRLEADRAALMALCIREGGKSVRDSVAEIREAVDLLRYYAARARADFAAPVVLPGVTGEENTLEYAPRGTFACISPWNFPLAIFLGQVGAALAAGNTVAAKPAEQTSLIAARGIGHLLAAGLPGDAVALLPGGGEVGARLVEDPRIDGVAFTGSTATARAIHRTLAARDGAIMPLIAETGGQNAMVVDSSALHEQVVRDVITSAFLSAGQRCSALRVLCVQDDTADRLLEMLAGAMAELTVGDPGRLATDVGPVIDAGAREALEDYARGLARRGRLIHRVSLPPGLPPGHWVAPVACEIDRAQIPDREVFGPVLHVLRYRDDRLEAVLDAVAATGYGLTLGIHSRMEGTVARVRARLGAGNTYVNRSMIGAVVGSQPFGGERLSGTGPKAGGPNYVRRFAVERALSVNTAAAGGNAALFASLDERGDGGG